MVKSISSGNDPCTPPNCPPIGGPSDPALSEDAPSDTLGRKFAPLVPCACSEVVGAGQIWIEQNSGGFPVGPVAKLGEYCYIINILDFFEVSENIQIAVKESFIEEFSNCEICCNQYVKAIKCFCDSGSQPLHGLYVKVS